MGGGGWWRVGGEGLMGGREGHGGDTWGGFVWVNEAGGSRCVWLGERRGGLSI